MYKDLREFIKMLEQTGELSASTCSRPQSRNHGDLRPHSTQRARTSVWNPTGYHARTVQSFGTPKCFALARDSRTSPHCATSQITSFKETDPPGLERLWERRRIQQALYVDQRKAAIHLPELYQRDAVDPIFFRFKPLLKTLTLDDLALVISATRKERQTWHRSHQKCINR